MPSFREMMRSDPGRWRSRDLAQLTVTELRDLAVLLGIAHSGRRDVLTHRLLTCAELRAILSHYDGPDELALHYSLRDLQSMAIAAGVYRGRTKYGAAASLLNWRNACRTKGQRTLDQARARQE